MARSAKKKTQALVATTDGAEPFNPVIAPPPGEPEAGVTVGKKRGRPAGKRQPELPAMTGEGVEKASVPEIDDASELYVRNRDRRMEAMKPEADAKAALMALMHQHKLKTYEYDDKIVEMQDPKPESVKVKTKPEFGAGDL